MASTAQKEPWEKKRPAKPVKHLSAAKKTKARASAKKAGRPRPSLVDNMNAAKAKKTTAKKTTAKKSTAKKSTAKKATAKRATAKRATAKKAASKRAPRTTR
jgi:DNA-binding protein HU-beta